MKTFRTAVAVALTVVLCLSACKGKDKIIPRSTMADIYAELFLSDHWLEQHQDLYVAADTMLFYEPVFRKYGYTTLDFRNSANYYLQDPRRFARIVQRASSLLEERAKQLESLSNDIEAIRNKIDRLRYSAHFPPVFYDSVFFARSAGYRVKMVQDEWGAWMPEFE